MAQANVDLGVFQETKLTDGIYTRMSSDYHVIATNAPSKHQGGVALFYRDSDQFQVEAYQSFGPNVISFQLVSGRRRWYVVGCYIPPTCNTTIEQVTHALSHRPDNAELLVVGDLNVQLEDPEGSERDEGIAAALAVEGLDDMSTHFCKHFIAARDVVAAIRESRFRFARWLVQKNDVREDEPPFPFRQQFPDNIIFARSFANLAERIESNERCFCPRPRSGHNRKLYAVALGGDGLKSSLRCGAHG